MADNAPPPRPSTEMMAHAASQEHNWNSEDGSEKEGAREVMEEISMVLSPAEVTIWAMDELQNFERCKKAEDWDWIADPVSGNSFEARKALHCSLMMLLFCVAAQSLAAKNKVLEMSNIVLTLVSVPMLEQDKTGCSSRML